MNTCIYCSGATKGKVCSLKICKNKYKQNHYQHNIEHYRFLKSEERKRNFSNRKSKVLSDAKDRYYSSDLKHVTAFMFQNAKSRAKLYKLEFDLDKSFLLNLFHVQDNKCSLTGISFEYNITNDEIHKRPFAPSLDRIDCNGGYTKNNVRLVCTIVNIALNEFGDEAFDKMCQSYMNNLS